jgi:hypothetical protein
MANQFYGQGDYKDNCADHFMGVVDTYDPDGADPGFIESAGVPANYSDGTSLSADDRVVQQSIFDRLPLSSKTKQEFYTWLCTDYLVEQQLEQSNTTPKSSISEDTPQEAPRKKRKVRADVCP